MASRTAGSSLRRAVHSSASCSAPPSKPIFRSNAAAGRSGSSGDSQASTSKLLPGASSLARAVDVAELPVLSKNKLKEKQVGTAMVYPELFASKVLDNTIPRTLRRDLSLTSRPTTVLRKATVSLVQQLQGAKQLKVVLEGRTGSGRSTVLLQTVAACQVDGYLILHIPDAYELVDAKYAFDQPQGKDTIYDQPVVAQLLLKRFLATNEKSALSKLDKSVLQAVEKGAKDVASASSALEQLLKSSSEKSPILVAIDSVEALYKTSKYVTVENKPIEPENLSVPRLLRACLSSKDSPSSLSITAIGALNKYTALSIPKAKKISPGPLSRTEAAGIYQHLYDTLLLENEPTDSNFLESLIGSDGNVLLFTRGLRAIPGTTARGVVKKGRSRGISVRNDKLHSIVVTEIAPSPEA